MQQMSKDGHIRTSLTAYICVQLDIYEKSMMTFKRNYNEFNWNKSLIFYVLYVIVVYFNYKFNKTHGPSDISKYTNTYCTAT